MSSCVVRTTNVSGRQHALECDVCRQWTTFFCADSDDYTFLVSVQGRKFQGTKVPGSESSRERKFQGAKVPGSESSTYGTFANSSIIRHYSMANVTQWLTWAKWPLNKGQGHSFWYQSISHIRFPISCQWYLCSIVRISSTAKRMKMDPYSRQRQNCSPQCPLNIGLLSSDV